MTAKEIKEKARLRNCLQLHDQTQSATMDKKYYFIDKFMFTESELQAFIDQLCREQREKCAEAYITTPERATNINFKAIENAPKPEL